MKSGCWLADWEGDPGRTMVPVNAKRFSTLSSATLALDKARKFRPFLKGQVQMCDD